MFLYYSNNFIYFLYLLYIFCFSLFFDVLMENHVAIVNLNYFKYII